MNLRTALAPFAAAAMLATGCAGSISPRSVRDELVRQVGAPPARELELKMGRLTTALLKSAIGPDAEGNLPLQGLTAIELAIYTLPPGASAQPLDFSEMTPWGWENVVRYKEGPRSALVMIRGGGDAIDDLALVVAGDTEIVYGRLRGSLPTTLPEAIREAVASGGTTAVKQQLLDASGQTEASEQTER